MKQKYYVTTDVDLFYRITTIIGNGGQIIQVVSLQDKHLIIYTGN